MTTRRLIFALVLVTCFAVTGLSVFFVQSLQSLHSQSAGVLIPWLLGTLISFAAVVALALIIFFKTRGEDKNRQNPEIEDTQRHEITMNAVNQVATLLLTHNNENVDAHLMESLELIGQAISVDRLHIWRNESINDEKHFILSYIWVSKRVRNRFDSLPLGTAFAHKMFPEWDEKVRHNKYVGGLVSEMPQTRREFFSRTGVKSIVMIPLFFGEKFWGMLSIDDCTDERSFTEEDIKILRLVSLMMASSMDRYILSEEVKDAHKRARILLDKTPLCCQLWDSSLNKIDCNEEAIRLFGLKNKQEFIEKSGELYPEYQPDGMLSSEKATILVKQAFQEGYAAFNWNYRMLDGEIMPAEVTLIRVEREDGYVVAGYTRDMRKHNKMMSEIEYHSKLLDAVNQASGFLLKSNGESFDKTVFDAMQVVAEAAKVDRMYIWRNHIIDGELHCSQIYEWSENVDPQQGKELVANLSYDEAFPEWRATLAKGRLVNSFVRNLSPPAKIILSQQGILSLLFAPIFIDGEFWGFIGFDDCHQEKVFTEDDEAVLSFCGLLFANAVLRNQLFQEILDKSTQLEKAVIEINEANIMKNNTLNSMMSILNSIDASIYATVPDTGELLFVNTHMKNGFGIEGDEAIGNYCYKVFRSGFDSMCDFCPCHKLNDNPEATIIWDEYIPEFGIHVRHSDRYIDWYDGSVVHLQHAIDITELVKTTEKVQAVSKAKSDFLANMSHEMRTPLNAIIGMTLIGKKAESTEDKVHALNKIGDASSHLLGVVDDILDMAKIEADRLDLYPVEYNFVHMIDKVLSVVHFRADEKSQKLTVDIDRRIPRYVIGDDHRLAQVITNILSNAVKFTRENGKVHLNISLNSEKDDLLELYIEVSDSGIGISQEEQERLFGAFEQVESGTSRQYGGSGLGLPISKRIVEMMGGRIWVESKLGKGSKFIFNVYAKRSDNTGDSLNENRGVADDAGKSELDSIDFNGKRLLVAEDVEINREIIVALLEDSGLIIDCAENGKEALDMISADLDKYDIVFMDLQMPHMGGLEATRLIREMSGRKRGRLPIIAMTANVFQDDVDACLAAGMDSHIGKPLDFDKVVEILRKYLSM